MDKQLDSVSQQELLSTYRRSLSIYLNQVAKQGTAFILPGLAHSIIEAYNAVDRIKLVLRSRNVQVEDLAIDQAAAELATKLTSSTEYQSGQPHNAVITPNQGRISLHNCIAAPALPLHYQQSKHDLTVIQNALSQSDDNYSLVVAIFGMGGVGKSACSIALCYDQHIQTMFPDGIIWLSIGRQTTSVVEQISIITTFLSGINVSFTNEQQAVNHLTTLLRDRAILIVLDDVWSARQVEPFVTSATHCRVLITTRDRTVALSLGAYIHSLATLSLEQSIHLLEGWAGKSDPALPKIAQRLTRLPLALKFAGAVLREGLTGEAWLRQFRNLSQLKLGRRSTSSQDNLIVCFELSIQQLTELDRPLYDALGIFADDTTIPVAVVHRLWQSLQPHLSDNDCDEILIDMSRIALIDLDLSSRQIAIHDLLLEFARNRLGEQAKATHEALLLVYNPQQARWWQVADDGYLYYQLSHHLIGAGHTTQLYHLLLGDTAWMEAKASACAGYSAYVADIERALNTIAFEETASTLPLLVGLHTAAQVARARSIRYTDDDLALLVWLQRYNEALNHARLRGDVSARCESLLALYKACNAQGEDNPALFQEIQELAHSISEVSYRAKTWIKIVESVNEDELLKHNSELVTTALFAVDSVTDISLRLIYLIHLAEAVTPKHVEWIEAFISKIVSTFQLIDARLQVMSLSRSIAWLSRTGIFDIAHRLASSIINPLQRCELLVSIFEHMSSSDRLLHGAMLVEQIKHELPELHDTQYNELYQRIALVVAKDGHEADAIAMASNIDDSDIYNRVIRNIQITIAQILPQRWPHIVEDLPTPLDRAAFLTELLSVENSIVSDQERLTACEQLHTSLIAIVDSKAQRMRRKQTIRALLQFHPAEAIELLNDIDDSERIELAELHVELLIKLERYSQAETIAMTLSDASIRSKALRKFALALAQSHQHAHAEQVFSESLRSGESSSSQTQLIIALSALAVAFARNNKHMFTTVLFEDIDTLIESPDTKVDGALSRHYTAIALAYAGRFREAIEQASRIEQTRRKDDTMFRIAIAAARANAFEHAEAALIHVPRDWRIPAALCHIAINSMAEGDYDRGIATLEETANAIWELRGTKVGRGWPMYGNGDPAEPALKALVRALMRCGYHATGKQFAQATGNLAILAIELASLGETDEALNYLRHLKSNYGELEKLYKRGFLGSSYSDVIHYLAPILASKGQLSTANEIMQMISLSEQRIHTMCRAALALYQRGNVQPAQDLIDRARILMSDIVAPYLRQSANNTIVETLAGMGRIHEALVQLGHCTIEDHLAALVYIAPIFEKVESGLAATILAEATRIAGWSDVWLRDTAEHIRGIEMEPVEQGPFQTPFIEAQRCVVGNPPPLGPRLQALLAYEHGIDAYLNGKLKLAETHFTQALALDANVWLGHETRSKAFFDQGRAEDALADLDWILNHESTDNIGSDTFVARGRIYLALQHYQAAIEDFTNAIKHNQSDSDIFSWRANTYWLVGNDAATMSDIEQAIALSQGEIEYYWRSIYHLSAGRFSEAEADLGRSWSHSSKKDSLTRTYTHIWRGVIADLTENHASALDNWASAEQSLQTVDDPFSRERGACLLAAVRHDIGAAYAALTRLAVEHHRPVDYVMQHNYFVLLDRIYPDREYQQLVEYCRSQILSGLAAISQPL